MLQMWQVTAHDGREEWQTSDNVVVIGFMLQILKFIYQVRQALEKHSKRSVRPMMAVCCIYWTIMLIALKFI